MRHDSDAAASDCATRRSTIDFVLDCSQRLCRLDSLYRLSRGFNLSTDSARAGLYTEIGLRIASTACRCCDGPARARAGVQLGPPKRRMPRQPGPGLVT
jgi:hypothetical protein